MLSDLQRRSGNLAAAESGLRMLLAGAGALPEARAALASILLELGQIDAARVEALEAHRAQPLDPAILEALVGIELTSNRPELAMQLIRPQRLRQPREQRWIAFEATAARMQSDPLHRVLYDYSRLVRVYELEAPRGWRSLADFNAAVRAALRPKHLFQRHPLDQSLRNGSQTARNLVTERDPAIQALLSAFAAPIADYVASLGSADDHPVSAPNTGAAVVKGCWSVELRRDGYHISHVHPQGWISSAYYVDVPSDVDDTEAKPGWIKFGQPGLPIPHLEAEHAVQPRAGRLVLFPSYMWHGTNPIRGDSTRLAVAFDAIPAGET
jgi:hypothetical protein